MGRNREAVIIDMDLDLSSTHQHHLHLTQNPLEIKVTLKKILEFVGSDHASLLNCRLVASVWNKTVVEVLKQNGAAIAVGCDPYPSGVVKGDRFVRSELGTNVHTHSGQFQYLCENRDKTDKVQDCAASVFDHLSLNLHINFFYESCVLQILRGVYDLPDPHVQSLNLTDRKIQGSEDKPTSQVVELLRLSAPNLVHLSYAIRTKKIWEPSIKACPIRVQWMPITFPKLESLSISLDDGCELNAYLLHIANSAPNLRSLSFTQSEVHTNQLQGRNLIRLKETLSPGTGARIQDLTIAIPGWMTPHTLEGLEFPTATKVTLQANSNSLLGGHLNEFLWQGLPALRSFECQLVDNMITASNALQMQQQLFPDLPNLEHFGFTLLHSRRTDSNANGIPTHFGLMPRNKTINQFLRLVTAQATNITSMSMDLDTMVQICTRRIITGPLLEDPLYVRAEFSNVTRLTLTGNMYTEEEVHGQPETMVGAMFPSLTELTVHLERDIYLEAPTPEFVIRSYVSGILAIEGIRKLSIKMFHKRWLADPNIDASAIDTTLEHLDLYQPDSEHWLNKLEPFPVSILRTILLKFTKLKRLGLDLRIFRDQQAHDGTGHDEILQQLTELKQEFPAVDIQFL